MERICVHSPTKMLWNHSPSRAPMLQSASWVSRSAVTLDKIPLYCPKCKQETIINVTGQNVIAVNKTRNDLEDYDEKEHL